MRESEAVTVVCPHCGETLTSIIDATQIGNDYIEDCAVCCRPMRLCVEMGENDLLLVTAIAD